MKDWKAFIEYNMRDIEMQQKVHERIVARYRLEYLPRYGSAWENMMLHDMHHYKGENPCA
jgi:hypothetical protein